MRLRPACPLCGSGEKQELLSLPYDGEHLQKFLQDYYRGRVNFGILANGNYIIDRCIRCGGMWQREILDVDGMKELYERWIEPEGSREKRKSIERHLQFARHCARLLRFFPEPEKTLLLDYGAGWGDWAEAAKVFEFQVHAVELSQERIDVMREKGIETYLPDNIPNTHYDFIYLEQVLEHIPDPKDLINKLTGMLKEQGYIHIGVPNGKSLSSQTGNPRQLLQKGPAQPLEHINIFTRASLISFMEQFQCHPAAQREGLLRCSSWKQYFFDSVLALGRLLPPTIFPPGTSLLFQKRSRS